MIKKVTNEEVKMLNLFLSRFSSLEISKEDLIAHINGPSHKCKLDGIYDNVFRPFFKYDQSFLQDWSTTVTEEKIVEAVWKKLSEYLDD